MEKDILFRLKETHKNEIKKNAEYNALLNHINENGSFTLLVEGQEYKAYTPELIIILTSKELSVFDLENKQEAKINGWDYIKTFIEGYEEGANDFNSNYKVSPDTLYGANAEQYVKDIHWNYFHALHNDKNEGWGYVKKQYPLRLTHKNIREHGYYSGIVSKLAEQVKKYPKLFANLDKCEHNLPPQPIVKQKETEETPKTFEELFYNTDLVTPSIDVLKEIEPPLIDTDYNYIGKLKGIICVWIDELQRQGIVKHYSDRKIFASLIPQKIKRFKIDESMFGKYHSKAETNYRTDIKTKVSKIKLSQSSH